MTRRIRDPKIHWFDFDCHCFDHHMRDSFTNTPGLVTCGICKRHVGWLQRFTRPNNAVHLTPAAVELAAPNVDAGAAAGEVNR